jgi:phage/conjugal plasmid C-4 type zinc finger TraR family protein
MADIADRAEEIESTARADALASMRRARTSARLMPSRERCEDCNATIPPERRRAVPGVSTCVRCQELVESRKARGLA